jgi:serine phosphatase RsbU (regulator of sigma subunit)
MINRSAISQVPLFATLPPAELDALASGLRQLAYPAQTILFLEGDHGDRFYIVLTGEIAIVKELGKADERLLGIRGPGEFVGEMSLLNRDGLRTASARVHQDAELLELTRAEFDALLQRQPLIASEMLRVLSRRLRQSNDMVIRDLREKNERLAQAYADLQAAQAQIIEQEALERELRQARQIQESMLPRTLPRLPGFDIGARMVPARMVGGDFFDLIPIGADSLGVVIGDVSGKGIPAALFMALTISLLRAEVSRLNSPEETLRTVNRHLLGMNARSMFVTMVYGVLQQASGEFAYVRAGHDPPLLWDKMSKRVPLVHGRGHPLGLLPSPLLDAQTVILPPGSTLLLYTDGVTEAKDAQGEFFGLEHLAVVAHNNLQASAQVLCDNLVDVLAHYQGTAAPADDITLVALQTH